MHSVILVAMVLGRKPNPRPAPHSGWAVAAYSFGSSSALRTARPARSRDEGAGSKNRRLSERISNSTMAQSIAVSTTKNRMFLMRPIALMIALRAPGVRAPLFARTKQLAGAGQIGAHSAAFWKRRYRSRLFRAVTRGTIFGRISAASQPNLQFTFQDRNRVESARAAISLERPRRVSAP